MHIYNTLTRKKEELVPIEPNHIRIYPTSFKNCITTKEIRQLKNEIKNMTSGNVSGESGIAEFQLKIYIKKHQNWSNSVVKIQKGKLKSLELKKKSTLPL